ncbi:MAG: hypothetical protein LBJ61_06110 [Deltaproteobacteria bacterium]|nr:hypothetical protein [Deltaproteobacteria bacterium]
MNATLKFNNTFQAGSLTLTPELRVGYAIAAKRLNDALTVGFAGASGAAKTLGTRSRGSHFQAGFSLNQKLRHG